MSSLKKSLRSYLFDAQWHDRDPEDVEGARPNSRIVLSLEAWLHAAPQLVLQAFVIGSGVKPGK